MKEYNEKNAIKVIGIDLAKNSFHVHGVNQAAHKVKSKKMSRQQLKTCMMNLPPCLVGMEACGGAHYWARLLRSWGHQVKSLRVLFPAACGVVFLKGGQSRREKIA